VEGAGTSSKNSRLQGDRGRVQKKTVIEGGTTPAALKKREINKNFGFATDLRPECGKV